MRWRSLVHLLELSFSLTFSPLDKVDKIGRGRTMGRQFEGGSPDGSQGGSAKSGRAPMTASFRAVFCPRHILPARQVSLNLGKYSKGSEICHQALLSMALQSIEKYWILIIERKKVRRRALLWENSPLSTWAPVSREAKCIHYHFTVFTVLCCSCSFFCSRDVEGTYSAAGECRWYTPYPQQWSAVGEKWMLAVVDNGTHFCKVQHKALSADVR